MPAPARVWGYVAAVDARKALTAVSVAAGAAGAVAAVVGARRVTHAAEADAAVADDLLSGYLQALDRLDPELLAVLAAEIAWDEWPMTVDRYDEDVMVRMSASTLRQLMEASAAAAVARVVGALHLGLQVGVLPDLPNEPACN